MNNNNNNDDDNYNSISRTDVTINYVVKNDDGNNLVYFIFFYHLKAIFLKTVFVGRLLSVVVHWTE